MSRTSFSSLGASGLAAAVALVLAVPHEALGQPRCYLGAPPCPSISPLDAPLRPYFISRRPGWPEHDFCYQVESPAPCNGCGECGGVAGESFGAPAGCYPSSQQTDRVLPFEFERLGRIPNDSLLEGAPVGN